MDFIKQILADSLNGFSIKFLPFFLFQIFSAALLALFFSKVWNYKYKTNVNSNSVLIASLITVLTSIVKYSMPGAVILAALVLVFVKKEDYKKTELLFLIITIGIGLGCGLGSIFQLFIGVMALSSILIFVPVQKDE